MPCSKALRDLDLEFMVSEGWITSKQAEVQKLRRDMGDIRNRFVHVLVLISLLMLFGYQLGLNLSVMGVVGGLAVYPLLKSVFSTWIKLAEIETDITYLEAGLELIRV